MLRAILLSLFWATCSTFLVRPWFWIGVIKKDLFNHDGLKIGFDNNNWKKNLYIEIVFFVFIFCISLVCYFLLNCSYNLYGSFPMIIGCFLTQTIWDYQGKIRYTVFFLLAIFFAISCIQDEIADSKINMPLNKVASVDLLNIQVDENGNQVKYFVSDSEIKNLFKASSALGPTYNNGKYIFTVSGGDNGNGIVIIDKNNYTKATFISCPYKFEISSIRSKYPTKKLKKLYVTISDDNVPYGLFAIADKTWLLGHYYISSYVLYNLTTGEAKSFAQEELPNFVTNN